MTDRLERNWWWTASRIINAGLFGDWSEPFCSRAWRHGWHGFNDAMQILFRDPVHSEAVNLRWQALSR